MIQLTSTRLLFRPPQLEDTNAIVNLANNWEVSSKTSTMPYPYYREDAIWFINHTGEHWQQNRDHTFAILRQADNCFIGMMGLHPKPFDIGEAGYWLGQPYWNNGYATEALQRLIQYGFEEVGLNRIQATYFVTNPASRRVMEKSGMVFEGVLREYIKRRDETYMDAGMCAILRRDWFATH